MLYFLISDCKRYMFLFPNNFSPSKKIFRVCALKKLCKNNIVIFFPSKYRQRKKTLQSINLLSLLLCNYFINSFTIFNLLILVLRKRYNLKNHYASIMQKGVVICYRKMHYPMKHDTRFQNMFSQRNLNQIKNIQIAFKIISQLKHSSMTTIHEFLYH